VFEKLRILPNHADLSDKEKKDVQTYEMCKMKDSKNCIFAQKMGPIEQNFLAAM
jgi:hypothetical protein